MIEGTTDLREMRAKWERYAERLTTGDEGGSLIGAAYIIARSGVTDVLQLLDLIDAAEIRVREVEGERDELRDWINTEVYPVTPEDYNQGIDETVMLPALWQLFDLAAPQTDEGGHHGA